MDFYFLQFLSRELKIDIERLAREYWEMMVLKEISQSKIGDFLIFGGNCLKIDVWFPSVFR